MDLNIKNNSTTTYVPVVELNVVRISSTSGTVRVRNADNGRNGSSLANAALFGYSNQLGSDQIFSGSEVSGSRSLEFTDSASELFTFDVAVTAYQSTGGASGTWNPEGGSTGGGSASGAPPAGPSTPLTTLTRVLRITANPLTRLVTVSLL